MRTGSLQGHMPTIPHSDTENVLMWLMMFATLVLV